MENEVLLKLVKCFEMSLLQSHEDKQFCLICLSIAKSIRNPCFLQNFDSPIGCRAINKFLERRISENQLSVLIRVYCRVTLRTVFIEMRLFFTHMVPCTRLQLSSDRNTVQMIRIVLKDEPSCGVSVKYVEENYQDLVEIFQRSSPLFNYALVVTL